MVIKTVYHFVDSNLGVKMASKKKLTEKEGEFWKLFFLGGGERHILGKEGFAWGTTGSG